MSGPAAWVRTGEAPRLEPPVGAGALLLAAAVVAIVVLARRSAQASADGDRERDLELELEAEELRELSRASRVGEPHPLGGHIRWVTTAPA